MKSLSLRFQLLVFGALIVAATTVWFARDRVSDAIAGVTGHKIEKSNSKRSRRRGRRGRGGGRGVPVIVAKVGQFKNDEKIAAIGTARARRSVMIHAKSDGIIMAFGPRAGDKVRKGDMIFELDKTQAELAVQIAAKRLEQARRLFERSQLLKKRNVNSRARVVDAKVVAERAELELRRAKKALSDLRIVAPFDGIVGLPKAEVGDRVSTTSPIVSLDRRDELLVEFEVPEKFAARISVNDKISAATPSHEHRRFAGRIERIDSRVDPVTRAVTMRAMIPNDKDLLRPGMSFAVEIVLPGSHFPSVPELSLQWRKGESYVWIVRKTRAEKIIVRTVKRLNSIVLVEGDLAPGDLVVVEGVQRLRPRRRVTYEPLEEPEPKAGQSKRSTRSEDRSKG